MERNEKVIIIGGEKFNAQFHEAFKKSVQDMVEPEPIMYAAPLPPPDLDKLYLTQKTDFYNPKPFYHNVAGNKKKKRK